MKKMHLRGVGLVALLVMGGCGSDNDSASVPGPAPAPAPVLTTLSGVVIDGPIQGATVCLDLNGDGSCGADEPASAKTDSAGNYAIGGVTEEQAASGAGFVAAVPADAIDADNPGVPVGTAYVMRAPGGKGALISPITTLIQAGVVQGLTVGEAESSVGRQLQVDPQNLYKNYVAEPSGADSEALSAAGRGSIVPALQAGTPLEVVRAGVTSQASYNVADFWFSDTNNWYLRYFLNGTATDDQGLVPYTDQRIWHENGELVPDQRAYGLETQTLRLTGQGWIKCDRAAIHYSAPGSPSYGRFCDDAAYTIRKVTDISGRSIAEVVVEVQAAPVNILRAVNPAAFGTSTFPGGSTLIRRVLRATESGVRYNQIDGSLPGTIAQVVATVQIPATPTGSNTISMGGLRDPQGNILKRVRVAFGPEGLAQYYVCDIVDGVTSNCVASSTGTYAVTTIHGVPAITFTNQPTESDPNTPSTRVFIERDGLTYYGYRIKADPAGVEGLRLNHVAFGAIATLLGIQAPAP